MATTPPHPGFVGDVPRIIRRVQWRPLDGDIGELVGGWVALASCAEGDALFCAGEGTAPAGLAPRFLSKEAFVALRDGERTQTGAIAWNGARYKLADVAEGSRLVLRLVAEGTAA